MVEAGLEIEDPLDDGRDIFFPSDANQVPYNNEADGRMNKTRIWEKVGDLYSLVYGSRMMTKYRE